MIFRSLFTVALSHSDFLTNSGEKILLWGTSKWYAKDNYQIFHKTTKMIILTYNSRAWENQQAGSYQAV